MHSSKLNNSDSLANRLDRHEIYRWSVDVEVDSPYFWDRYEEFKNEYKPGSHNRITEILVMAGRRGLLDEMAEMGTEAVDEKVTEWIEDQKEVSVEEKLAEELADADEEEIEEAYQTLQDAKGDDE